ncbi:MAG: sigma 54-interacting transcriptional regulator [Bacteriovoracaceae bacterium]|jgi:Nif-specific regulatory protein|nr:sigma 54-interacting transcriptional regulator [Bacteriovoracaceae bacterium]
MFNSFSEFKFFQSFRIPVESCDNVRFMVEKEELSGKFEFIDGDLKDCSITGLGFISKTKISVNSNLRFSIQFKKIRIDLEGHIVRSFGYKSDEELMLYGVELDEDDQVKMKRFITQYVSSFSPDRARECLSQMALSERYKQATEGFEVFSLMLSLFKDITAFGSKENFLVSMLEEITRVLNSQRASIFLINPHTNELEAVAALGTDKDLLKFDYRKGIAGSVFTTGVSLNIDTQTDSVRFSKTIDDKTGFVTKSILCSPITNREDKVIGVIEVINKRNELRFTVEDEKTMKVLQLIFSSVFHNYNPISEKSLIRRFSTPYDRKYAYIGRSQSTNDLRKSIVQLKDIDSPILVKGEQGTGKKLFSHIVHNEGKRGLNKIEFIHCKGNTQEDLERMIFGSDDFTSFLESCANGTVVFSEITYLPLNLQHRLIQALEQKRIPGSKLTIDSRVIFTTSRDVEKMAHEEGTFNSKLYDYMTKSIFYIEPLRKRPEDVEGLLSHFLRKECRKQGLLLKEFSDEVKEQLEGYDWPGNVKELQSAVEKAVLYNPKAHVITKLDNGNAVIVDLSKSAMNGFDNIPHARDFSINLKDRVALVERQMILAEIKRNKGNKSKAAKEMGISREALRKKMIQSDNVLEKLSPKTEKKAA